MGYRIGMQDIVEQDIAQTHQSDHERTVCYTLKEALNKSHPTRGYRDP